MNRFDARHDEPIGNRPIKTEQWQARLLQRTEPTNKICSEDLRRMPEAGLVVVANLINLAIDKLFEDGGHINSLSIRWVNRPDKVENPDGCVGHFELHATRSP